MICWPSRHYIIPCILTANLDFLFFKADGVKFNLHKDTLNLSVNNANSGDGKETLSVKFEAVGAKGLQNAINGIRIATLGLTQSQNQYAAAVAAFKNFGGWPMGAIAAGLTIAEGMAKVAMIRQQQYTGKRFGGPVKEGTPYMVGESGKELFVPNQSGTIVPNNALGGGDNVNVTFNIKTVDASGFDQLLSTRRAMIVNMINSAVNEQGKASVV